MRNCRVRGNKLENLRGRRVLIIAPKMRAALFLERKREIVSEVEPGILECAFECGRIALEEFQSLRLLNSENGLGMAMMGHAEIDFDLAKLGRIQPDREPAVAARRACCDVECERFHWRCLAITSGDGKLH